MNNKIKIKTKYIVLTVTFLCIGLLITTSLYTNITIIDKTVGYIVTPVQRVFDSVGTWFSGTVDTVTNLSNLQEENNILKQEVAKLKEENIKLVKDQAELLRLRELYKLNQQYDSYPVTAAQIIAKAPGNWYNTFIIDKGKADGLQPNLVIIADGGLVGHIVKVSDHYSTVQGIVDDNSSVHANIIRTNDTLFVEGDKQLLEDGLCKVTFIDSQAEIVEGDQVITSSLGDIYPPGITIGTITKVEENPHSLTKTAFLKPVVNFNKLNEVLIITEIWKDDFREEADELGLE